jgi:uncharacterized protein (AIM24 family)
MDKSKAFSSEDIGQEMLSIEPAAGAADSGSSGWGIMKYSIPEEVTFQIIGDDCQVLNIETTPGQQVVCEPGCMMHMSADTHTSTHLAPCCGCYQCCGGESIFKVHYTNNGQQNGYIGLTPSYPSKIVPINLDDLGGTFYAKPGAFMCSVGGKSQVGFSLNTKCGACCWGGAGDPGCCQGLMLQKISGSGFAFLTGGGTILARTLGPDEKVIVDSTSVLGWQGGVKNGIEANCGPCNCCCSGEGMFNTVLTGPGLVLMQSMSFYSLKKAVGPMVGAGKDDGGVGDGGDGGSG